MSGPRNAVRSPESRTLLRRERRGWWWSGHQITGVAGESADPAAFSLNPPIAFYAASGLQYNYGGAQCITGRIDRLQLYLVQSCQASRTISCIYYRMNLRPRVLSGVDFRHLRFRRIWAWRRLPNLNFQISRSLPRPLQQQFPTCSSPSFRTLHGSSRTSMSADGQCSYSSSSHRYVHFSSTTPPPLLER